jgi:single-strand DNA-binding protein
MAMGLNKVTLIGNVGKDPEVRTMQDGREMATFNLATSETWKSKTTNERQTKTEWHRIVVFSEGLVGVIKNYVTKGSKLYIEGSLQTRKWTGTDNIEKFSTEVVLQGFNTSLILLDAKEGGSYTQPQGEPSQQLREPQSKIPSADHQSLMEELDDEVPF